MFNKEIGAFRYMQLIALLLAVAVFLILYFERKNPLYRLERDGVETTGLITSIESHSDSDIEHRPNTYEFKSADGVLHRGITQSKDMLLASPEYFVPVNPAAKSTVVYLKDNPSVNRLKVSVASGADRESTTIFLSCLGGCYLLFSVFFAWLDYKDRHQKPVWNLRDELEQLHEDKQSTSIYKNNLIEN